MKTMKTSALKRGFTLIELLVVITIIAILAGLAVPAMVGVLDRANQTRDVNNCRQVGIVLFTKASENNGVYPNSLTGGPGAGAAANSTDVFTALLQEGYLQDTSIFAGSGIAAAAAPSDGNWTTYTLPTINNAWDYVQGLKTTSSSALPLVVSYGTGYTPAAVEVDISSKDTSSALWGNKGLVMYTVGQTGKFMRAKAGKIGFDATVSSGASTLKP